MQRTGRAAWQMRSAPGAITLRRWHLREPSQAYSCIARRAAPGVDNARNSAYDKRLNGFP